MYLNKKKYGLYFQGFFKVTGIDINLFHTANFPKKFFYGTYRFRFYYIPKNNEVYGCLIIIIELKQPWETNN